MQNQQPAQSALSVPLVTVLSPLDALAAELGASAARIERELRGEAAVVLAELRREMEAVQRRTAEMELRALTAERALADSVRERLAAVRDGASVTIEDVRPLVVDEIARQVAALPKAADAEALAAAVACAIDGRVTEIATQAAALLPVPTVPDVPALVDHAVTAAFAVLPVPENGKDADPEMIAVMVGGEVAKAAERLRADLDLLAAEQLRPEAVEALVNDRVAAAFIALPIPQNGKDADTTQIEAWIADEVSMSVGEMRESIERTIVGTIEALPPPLARDDIASMIDEAVAPIQEAINARPAGIGAADVERRIADTNDALRQEWEAKLLTVDQVRDIAGEQIATALPATVERAVADALAGLPTGIDAADVDRRITDASDALRQEWKGQLQPVERALQIAGQEITAALPQHVTRAVADAVAALPPPEPGHTPTEAELAPIVEATVTRHIAALPPPKDGERGPEGPPGKLPVVRAWTDAVHYEGAVTTHNGATWQALRDTGREPPHEDWICLAAPGRDGADGRSFAVCGTYSATIDDYRALDVVALNGGAFVAVRDAPGPCPGDGWRMIAMRGKAGEPGAPGRKGDKGDPGPGGVRSIEITGDALLIARNADGSEAQCDLYPILSNLQAP